MLKDDNRPEITKIEKIFVQDSCTFMYVVEVVFTEEPKLRLGRCEVNQ